MLVVLALAALAILAGVVAVAMGRGGELKEFPPDVPPLDLPEAGQLSAVDFAALQLPVSLVGYHTQSVDETLQRAAVAISARDTRIAVLEQRVTELLAGRLQARQEAQAVPPRLAHEPGAPETPRPPAPWTEPAPEPRDAPSAPAPAADPAPADAAGADAEDARRRATEDARRREAPGAVVEAADAGTGDAEKGESREDGEPEDEVPAKSDGKKFELRESPESYGGWAGDRSDVEEAR
ncbi:hypothetical protein [Microtetraspora sp. NBRC 13810]|uniref:hypothetical protein n=1 Tax=Microtetraspora sp. NBRC 13810 TaxID=3030990 RepID=UPI0025567733|nr:hypothetical protein [Microtetraspora sp. NBRC 13810]